MLNTPARPPTAKASTASGPGPAKSGAAGPPALSVLALLDDAVDGECRQPRNEVREPSPECPTRPRDADDDFERTLLHRTNDRVFHLFEAESSSAAERHCGFGIVLLHRQHRRLHGI